MAAQRRDIDLATNEDFEWNFRLETSNCSVINIDNYGLRMMVKDSEEGTTILTVTHNTYAAINATLDEFQIDIPQSAISAVKETFRANNWKGVYDIVVFPGASTPTADPFAVVYGKVRYRVGPTTLG